jgi:uncharacterized protein YggE
MRRVILLFIALSAVATGQTLDGISAPVSRTVKLTADEATFTIAVASTLDSTQAQVKQALENAGVPKPTVVATGLEPGGDSSGTAQLLYSATVAIPAGSALDVTKRLEKLRTRLTAPLRSLQYSAAINPSQATVDDMRQVVMPQLLDDARSLAQSLAAATGVKVGAIRSISDSGGTAGAVLTQAERIGDFSGAVGIPDPLTSVPSSTQYTFYVNVVFAAVQ